MGVKRTSVLDDSMLNLIAWVGLSKLDLKLVDVYGGGTYMCCCFCISLGPAVGIRVCPGRCVEVSSMALSMKVANSTRFGLLSGLISCFS